MFRSSEAMPRILVPLLIVLQIFGATCIANTVAEIRSEWQALQTDTSLAFGQRLHIASDAYTPAGGGVEDANQAEQLFALAERAAELGQASLALQLATEAVHADSNCEPARRALGYEKHEGSNGNATWLTPYQARMAKRDKQWHSDYGWIKQEDLPRYKAGERRIGRRWVPVEVDASQHADIAEGWQIRTDHFVVTTNHSLATGARLAAELEELFQVWRQLFADFYIDASELRARFSEGRTPGVRSRPFQVVQHATRQQYNHHLFTRQPRIAETIGIYFDRQREAHFFVSDSKTANGNATLYHEAVHQLFQESERARREAGAKANFWAIEGVATWFESLVKHDDKESGVYFTIGEAQTGRLPAARQRLLHEGYRVPLAELVQLGKGDLQTRSDLAPLYSQAAGLATFLMADVELRPAFVTYLKLLYAGRTEPATLADLTNKTYPELDSEYRSFLARTAKP